MNLSSLSNSVTALKVPEYPPSGSTTATRRGDEGRAIINASALGTVLTLSILSSGAASTTHVSFLGAARTDSAVTSFTFSRRQRLSRREVRQRAIAILHDAERQLAVFTELEARRFADGDET